MRFCASLIAPSLAWAILTLISAQAHSQDYPAKPIRIVVPFSPGGVADNSARVVADALGARLGQQVLVENRPGASGNIGTQAVAQAAPDGYLLLLGFDGTMVINPQVFARMPFDTLKDFAPVTKLGDATLILVAHPSLPAKPSPNSSRLPKRSPARTRTAPRAPAARRTSRASFSSSAPASASSTCPTKAADRRSPTSSAARSRSSSPPSPPRSSTSRRGGWSGSACRE
jgi:tripartite-type tricarboxylate transporter receptor subunit TctC